MKSIAFLLIMFMEPLYSVAPASDKGPTGTYEITATVGDSNVPGTIELYRKGDIIYGRMTIVLAGPMHIALQTELSGSGYAEASLLDFRVSSPAVGLSLSFDNDTVTGTLTLPRNLQASIAGTLQSRKPISAGLDAQFNLAPYSPGVISSILFGETFPTTSSDGNTMYFTRYVNEFQKQTIMMTSRTDGNWTHPAVASFSARSLDRSPMITPDGKRLYFASKRPLPDTNEASEVYNLWYVNLSGGAAIGDAVPVSEVNSDANDYQPSMTSTGALYFTSDRAGGHGGQDIYEYYSSDGRDDVPYNLGEGINTEASEISAYISPNGKMLIISSSFTHENHVGNDDLYVSFKEDGSWTTPVNLGPNVNSFANEYGASLSADSRYLLFTSDRRPPADVYRVEIRHIAAIAERWTPNLGQ